MSFILENERKRREIIVLAKYPRKNGKKREQIKVIETVILIKDIVLLTF